MKKSSIISLSFTVLVFLFLYAVPTTINDFFMPESQPGQSGNLEQPNKYDIWEPKNLKSGIYMLKSVCNGDIETTLLKVQ